MKAKKAPRHFGVHLMFDGYGCPENRLNDRELIETTLLKIAKDLGMIALSAPHVLKAPGNNKRDPGGYSGFIVIAESHISLHTFHKRGFISADVYSCKDFDVKKAETDLKEIFKVKKAEVQTAIRGRHYPPENIYK